MAAYRGPTMRAMKSPSSSRIPRLSVRARTRTASRAASRRSKYSSSESDPRRRSMDGYDGHGPRTFSGLDPRGFHIGGEIDDRYVVGWSVGAVQVLPIGRERYSPGTRPHLDGGQQRVCAAVEHQDRACAPGTDIDFAAGCRFHAHRPRTRRQCNDFQYFQVRRIDDVQLAGGFRGNESYVSPGQKRHASRAHVDLEMADGGVPCGLDGVDFTARFASHVEALSIGGRGHTLGLLTDRDDMLHFSRGDVDDAGGFHVFVRYIEFGAVLAECELLRVRARIYLAHQLPSRNVHDADRIGRFVRLDVVVVIVVVLAPFENRIAFGVQLGRRRNRSAAQSHIDRFAVRGGMNAARALTHRDRGERLLPAA